MLEVLVALLIAITHCLSTTPGSQSMILNCLGRNEVFFEFDYFIIGGHQRGKGAYCQIENGFGKCFCYGTIISVFILESNLFEIYLIGKVIKEMKENTNDSANMLSRKAFQERKRYNTSSL